MILPKQLRQQEKSSFKMQDAAIDIPKHCKIISIHDSISDDKSRRNIMKIDGRTVKTRGSMPNTFTRIDWLNPMSVMKTWLFIVPFEAHCRGIKDLQNVEATDWRNRVDGISSGF